ncbi:MAG: hypothetical protein ACQETD_04585 [Pseudomonadota bacterium]
MGTSSGYQMWVPLSRLGLGLAFLLLAVAVQAQQGLSRAEVKKYLQTRIEVADLQNEYKANADQYDNVVQAFYRARGRLVVERGYASAEAFDEMKQRIWAAYGSMDEYEEIERRIRERQRKSNGEDGKGDAEAQKPKRRGQFSEEEKRRRMLAHIDQLPISEEQKKVMLAQLEAMPRRTELHRQIQQDSQRAEKRRLTFEQVQTQHERERMAQLERNRADWPAVRHYRDTIDAIVDWYNGNTDKRPVVK